MNLVKNMRRSRMGRSRFRSSIHRSSFGYRYGSSGNQVPLKGPAAIIFTVGILLFILSFAFNFIYIFTTDSFNIIFFFMPIGIIFVMMITLFIYSIVDMVKNINGKGTNPNLGGGVIPDQPQVQPQGFFKTNINLLQMAQQAGLKVTILPNNDSSKAQGLIANDRATILIKSLSGFESYQNGMVQDLSKGLAAYQAHEAWLIQTPATFVENDLNFARFYNVKLMTAEQAIAALQTLITPKPSEGR